MNLKYAKEYLPFVQAAAEGKTIQKKYINGEWYDEIGFTNFNLSPDCYRIKPQMPKPQHVTIEDIVNYLNEIVKSNNLHYPFFDINNSNEYIFFRKNCNLDIHTKLIALIIFYFGNITKGYISLGCNNEFAGYIKIDDRESFMNFLKSLGKDIEKVNIKKFLTQLHK